MRSDFALFFDAGCFASEIPEVIELCATDSPMTFHLDAIDGRRIQRKHAFHTDPARHLPYREHLTAAAAATRHHNALENLDALFIAFLDLHVHPYCVAESEVRKVFPHLAGFYNLHQVS